MKVIVAAIKVPPHLRAVNHKAHLVVAMITALQAVPTLSRARKTHTVPKILEPIQYWMDSINSISWLMKRRWQCKEVQV